MLADYTFDEDTSSAVGTAPDLEHLASASVFTTITVDGETLQVLEVEPGEGLRLAGLAELAEDEYTFLLRVRLASNPSYQKIVDFKNRAADQGLYLFDDFLRYFGDSPEPPYTRARQVAGDELVQIALTRRSSDDLVRVYLNGKQAFAFIDDGGLAEIGTDGVIHFLMDDTQFSSTENPQGVVDRIRIWDTALTDEEIADLAPDPGASAPLLSKVADYEFDSTLTSDVGSVPALEYLGSGATYSGTRLTIEAGSGLRLAPATGVPSDRYTMVFDMTLVDTSGWRKIVDFASRSVNPGVYLNAAFPVFASESPIDGLPTVEVDVPFQMAVTRDSFTERVNVFIDGEMRLSFLDAGGDAVVGGTGELFFLVDDTAGGGADHPEGSIDRLRIWDGAMTPAQIEALVPVPGIFHDAFEASAGGK